MSNTHTKQRPVKYILVCTTQSTSITSHHPTLLILFSTDSNQTPSQSAFPQTADRHRQRRPSSMAYVQPTALSFAAGGVVIVLGIIVPLAVMVRELHPAPPAPPSPFASAAGCASDLPRLSPSRFLPALLPPPPPPCER